MLIGVDIVDIARIKQVINRTPRFLQRVFTVQELDYCFSKKDPYPSLAARFAAREALRKIDNIFIKGIGFHDSEVMVDSEGRPQLTLYGEALAKARDARIHNLDISLSHSREQAIAVVIAEKG